MFEASAHSALNLFHKLRIPTGLVTVAPTMVGGASTTFTNPVVVNRVIASAHGRISDACGYIDMTTHTSHSLSLEPCASQSSDFFEVLNSS